MTTGENAAAATRQRDAFVRVLRVVAFFAGRPPSRPLAREARAFASLRFAPTRAATPSTVTRVLPRSETRAARTRAPGRLAGCTFKYSASTAQMARSWWYARRFPEHLRSVVLLSPNPPSQRLFESVGQDTMEVLDSIVAHCQADAECARAFPRLAANMQPVLAAVAGERLVGLPLLLYSTSTARRLPWLIYQARPASALAPENALDGALREGQRFGVPHGFRDRFSSSARALLISGEWDPTTGPRWAREMGTYFARSTVLTIS